jgi:hypothetical protein
MAKDRGSRTRWEGLWLTEGAALKAKRPAEAGRGSLSPPGAVGRVEAHPELAMKEGSLVPPPAYRSVAEPLWAHLDVARFDVVEERLCDSPRWNPRPRR